MFFKKRRGAGPGLLESKHREAQAELMFPCLQRGSHAYIHQNTHTHKSIRSGMAMSSTSTDVHTQSHIRLDPETHMLISPIGHIPKQALTLPTDRCRGRRAFSHTGNRHVHTPSCTHTHKHVWILTHAHTHAPQRCIKSYINPDTLKHTCTDTSSMHAEVHTHSDV